MLQFMRAAPGIGGDNRRCHKLPPRHLEPVLQALVRDGILRGIRGPHGGYELGRNGDQISADDILQAASAVEGSDEPLAGSALVKGGWPALAEIERMFSAALDRSSSVT